MPIFIATNNEYNIAVITPAHSKILSHSYEQKKKKIKKEKSNG